MGNDALRLPCGCTVSKTENVLQPCSRHKPHLTASVGANAGEYVFSADSLMRECADEIVRLLALLERAMKWVPNDPTWSGEPINLWQDYLKQGSNNARARTAD